MHTLYYLFSCSGTLCSPNPYKLSVPGRIVDSVRYWSVNCTKSVRSVVVSMGTYICAHTHYTCTHTLHYTHARTHARTHTLHISTSTSTSTCTHTHYTHTTHTLTQLVTVRCIKQHFSITSPVQQEELLTNSNNTQLSKLLAIPH